MTNKNNIPGGGPWGQRPSSGGGMGSGGNSGGGGGGKPTPPDLEEMIRKSQERFKDTFGGGGKNDDDGKRGAIVIAAIGAVLWLASGFFVVQSDEQGVVLRFGEYHRTEMPGLHYHLPWPVETVYKPSVTSVSQEKMGGEASLDGVHTESIMLTQDLNLVDVNFDVQWKIDSSKTDDFLFKVRDAELLVKPVAESAMREVVGQTPLQSVIKEQSKVAEDCKAIIQRILSSYQAGITVLSVNLNKPDVPEEVIDAFQEIKRAEQEKNTLINKAEAYRNDIIPRARGRSVQLTQDALAYQQQVSEKAKGDAARFLSVYEEYKNAKDVTRRRIYLETMEEILGKMNKTLVDGKGGSGVVPYLPLKGLK